MTTTTDRNTFLTILRDGPDALKAALTTLAILRSNQADCNRELARRRQQIAVDVANATGEDGKKFYTNETARAAAIADNLESDALASGMQATLDHLAREIANASIEVEFRQELLRSARAAALLLRDE